MKIPSRIAVGFMTVDRADKNKGWYWYYANQSHAWVEVYFPGYGWIDFDTTVGNEESRGASSPDGTPPSPPAKAPLAIHGKAIDIDTLQKTIGLRLDNITFKDKVYDATGMNIKINGAKANVLKDTIVLRFSNIKKGDDLICVSYDNNLYSINGKDSKSILAQIKSPIAIDDIYINDIIDAKKENNKPEIEKNPMSAWQIIARVFGVLLLLLLLFLAIPNIIRLILLRRTKQKDATAKLNAINNYTNFYLHQLGFGRNNKTPFEHAKIMDEKWNMNYTKFTNTYLSLKYSDAKPTDNDVTMATLFIEKMHNTVQKQIPFKKRFLQFLQPITTINYLIQQAQWKNK
jgi:hypothetical protein